MNGYNRQPMVASKIKSIPISDMTTSMGIGYSPHVKNVYFVNKDDNISGTIQSGNYLSSSYQNHGHADIYYASGRSNNYNYRGYANQNYPEQNPKSTSQARGRLLSSNAIAGKMLTSKENKTERSFGQYNH
uniref:Uncharacterized protein n=1 Tax=Euplotes crassus TaxID=5936 RepID=A0A7S3KED5_EUPCR|mmetsp:Transcript_22822/g.22663  ORF Transcript_22822/g.22663 Transcript_22822/m.22663 type:complete len:131 (+) Transcript_22822:536-928(+)